MAPNLSFLQLRGKKYKEVSLVKILLLRYVDLRLFSAKSPISAEAIAWLKISIFGADAVSLMDSSFFDPFESNTIQEEESPGTEKKNR